MDDRWFNYDAMLDKYDSPHEDWWDYDNYIHNVLDLKGCSNLKSLSKMFGNIKYINLRLTAIEELHSSIGSLHNLILLNLKDCKCLKNLPSNICDLESLTCLDLDGCFSINKFPVLPPNIRALNLSGTSIKQVDESSFERLPHLKILLMNNCSRLETLPTTLCKWKSLRILSLSGCSKLNSFPEILETMKHLLGLFLNETKIKELPSSIENLNGLKVLSLTQCKYLESIPTSICKLKSLKTLSFSGCSKLNSFPEILEPMEFLHELLLDETRIKELPSSIENLNGLQGLYLRKCKDLEFIPISIYNIKGLCRLDLNECPRLKHLPTISVESSQYINVCLSYRNILKLYDWHKNLSSLEMLDPSNTIFGRIPIHIIRKRYEGDKSDMSFTICKCGYSINPKRCKLFLEKHFGGDHWTGGSTRLTRYRCKILTELSYCIHCLNVDKVCNILTTEFRRTVLHRTTASIFKHGIQEADHPRISISYPGIKIPEWFTHYTMGSSIDINFSPPPCYFPFLGFALCIVVDCDKNWFCNSVYWEISCVYHFKTKDGESHQYRWILRRGDCTYPHGYESEYLIKVSESSQVFMWHLYEDDYHYYHDATGASFKFYIDHQSDDLFVLFQRITKCGIRSLTVQDAEEFSISKRIPAQNINFDTNKPHPKRTKIFS